MKKVSAVMRWIGPAAIIGAAFVVVSDQVGLVVHLPEMGADSMGYYAVGSGLFLLVFTLLLVGMFGLYAGRPDPGAPKVIEYGDARARYVLVREPEETSPIRRAGTISGLASGNRRALRRPGGSGTERTPGRRGACEAGWRGWRRCSSRS